MFVSFVVAKCTFFVFLSAFLCDDKSRKGMKNVSDEFEAFAKEFLRVERQRRKTVNIQRVETEKKTR